MKFPKLSFVLIIVFFAVNVFASIGEAVSEIGSLSSTVTAINDNSQSPTVYYLEQNHPNPFNPTTTISYNLPEQAHVLIKVFDVNGKDIATLVNRTQNLGRYNLTFDASTLTSGVYYYRIIANDFLQTHKMILVK